MDFPVLIRLIFNGRMFQNYWVSFMCWKVLVIRICGDFVVLNFVSSLLLRKLSWTFSSAKNFLWDEKASLSSLLSFMVWQNFAKELCSLLDILRLPPPHTHTHTHTHTHQTNWQYFCPKMKKNTVLWSFHLQTIFFYVLGYWGSCCDGRSDTSVRLEHSPLKREKVQTQPISQHYGTGRLVWLAVLTVT